MAVSGIESKSLIEEIMSRLGDRVSKVILKKIAEEVSKSTFESRDISVPILAPPATVTADRFSRSYPVDRFTSITNGYLSV
jgi:hypothetical protein